MLPKVDLRLSPDTCTSKHTWSRTCSHMHTHTRICCTHKQGFGPRFENNPNILCQMILPTAVNIGGWEVWFVLRQGLTMQSVLARNSPFYSLSLMRDGIKCVPSFPALLYFFVCMCVHARMGGGMSTRVHMRVSGQKVILYLPCTLFIKTWSLNQTQDSLTGQLAQENPSSTFLRLECWVAAGPAQHRCGSLGSPTPVFMPAQALDY